MSENSSLIKTNNNSNMVVNPITASTDFVNEIRALNVDTTLSFFQKNSMKKQILKKYLNAKEVELDLKETNYIKSLKMVDDVTSQSRASIAQKEILKIEADFQEFVAEFGIENDRRLMTALIKHAEMIKQQFDQLNKADIDSDMRQELFTDFRNRAKQTKNKLISGIEDYLDKLNSTKA